MSKKNLTELTELLTSISDKNLMSDVLSNLATPQELHEISLRLQIFKGLNEGRSQRALARDLNVSLATISRGSREFQYGKQGIKKILNND